MINIVTNTNLKPLIKQKIFIKLKPLHSLQNINIFAMPPKIKDKDIISMFNGILTLMREKIQQEQTEKYLKLKLKYTRLKYLYDKIKLHYKNICS